MPPHESKFQTQMIMILDVIKEQNLDNRTKIKDDQWFTMYGDLVTKY